MNYQRFIELCKYCYVSRKDVEYEYNLSPNNPWSSINRPEYTNSKRENNAKEILDKLFQEEELSIEDLSINIYIEKNNLKRLFKNDPIWSTFGNIKVAIAKSYANCFIKNLEVLSEELDIEEIRKNGKTSPYGNMKFPIIDKNLNEELEESADYTSADMMYNGNLLAMLIAREYAFEELMP